MRLAQTLALSVVSALGLSALGGVLPAGASAADVTCSVGPSNVTVSVAANAEWNDGGSTSGRSNVRYEVFGYQTIQANQSNGSFTVTIPHNQGAQGPSVGNFTDGSAYLEIAQASQSGCEGLIVNGAYRGGGDGVQSYLNSQGLLSAGTYGIVPEFFGPAALSQATVSVTGSRVQVQLPETTESSAWHWAQGGLQIGATYSGRPSLHNTGTFINSTAIGGYSMVVLVGGQFQVVPMTLNGTTLSGTLPQGADSFGVVAESLSTQAGQRGHGWLQVEQALTSGATATRFTSGPWVDPTRNVGYAFSVR